MQEKNLHQILNQEETKKELIETFQKSLEKMFSLHNQGNDIDNTVIAQGQSEKEQEVLREVCEEIHVYHQNMRDIHSDLAKNPDLTEEEWLKAKLHEVAKELIQKVEGREINEDEKKYLMEQYDKALDNEIVHEAHLVEAFAEIQKKTMLDESKEGTE